MFKVVPDQLRISEGWVRCGHCAEVFDASAHLQQDAPGGDDTPLAPPAGAAEVETGARVPGRAEADVHAAADSTLESSAFQSSLNTHLDDGAVDDAPDTAQLEDEARALIETPLDQPFELRRQDSGAVESRPARFEPLPEEPELHDLSFVRKARRQEFWRRPGVRALLVLLLLVLAGLLAVQLAVHDRDRLAASQPALRSWLVRLCQPLRCRVAPPRQIDAISIDSSSFNKLRGDAYRLNFTLKNQGATEVATPALELTLTDAQDRPVLRRVLLPADLGASPGVIGAAAEWSGSLALAVAANGTVSRIAGYRLLAFYP